MEVDRISMELNDYQEKTRRFATYPGKSGLKSAPMLIKGRAVGPTTGSNTETWLVGNPDGLIFTALGLAEESGELVGKVRKALRDDMGVITAERLMAIKLELGDILNNLAMAADEIHVSLQEIAEMNIEKMTDRLDRDAIKGEGDYR